jgi:hypothetical protein
MFALLALTLVLTPPATSANESMPSITVIEKKASPDAAGNIS